MRNWVLNMSPMSQETSKQTPSGHPFEPPTSASGDQCTSHVSLRFPGFRDSVEYAEARETVSFCALTGLVIPPHIVWLARHVLDDPAASVRELILARWVLLSTLKESRDG